jgi:hypothetical protein
VPTTTGNGTSGTKTGTTTGSTTHTGGSTGSNTHTQTIMSVHNTNTGGPSGPSCIGPRCPPAYTQTNMSVQNTHTGATTGSTSHTQINSGQVRADNGVEVGRMNKSAGSYTHTQTNMSVQAAHGYATTGSAGTSSAMHGGSVYGGSTYTTHSMANNNSFAPNKPVPCTTGYVNGVCRSGSTTGGNHGPGLPGGICPSGQYRGPGGNCTKPLTGNSTSTGSTSHFGAGQNHGGAQPMISHSQGSHSSGAAPSNHRR